MARKNTHSEMLEDDCYSSEDIETYKPSNTTNTNELEVDEEAYQFILHIDLEWPTMSLDLLNSKIILGTFPDDGMQNKSELVEIDIENIEENSDRNVMNFRRTPIGQVFNKVRVSDAIFALTDNSLLKYSFDFKLLAHVKGSYRFGLHLSKYVIVGCENGFIEIYNNNLELIKKFSTGTTPVECVAFENDRVYSGSIDGVLRVFDLSGTLLHSISNDFEINAVDIRNGKLIFGDENGKIHLLDLETGSKDVFEWHCTPISFLRWRDDEIFASGSDEQLCLWDITLEEEDETLPNDETLKNKEDDIPNNLLFVHQGQSYYKDCAFYDNKVVATSENGLCVFSPLSFCTEPFSN
ncbi:Ribosome assembly protein rrb1 [Glugoides intestinalis]